MGALIDYWYYTGDSRYNKLATQGLLWQVGPNRDYMPPNQTMTEGNDDQGFWGMAVMSAAEYRYPDPPDDEPQWLALAQAVFNTQAARWDPDHCGGGLRWQIFTWNNGFNYKNAISNACFFNLAARLALFTGNQSYADWADKTWDWMKKIKFLDDSYYVYDGAHIETGCTNIVPYQFSYNAGAFLLGAAAMYNQSTGARRDVWRERVDGLLNGTMVFFVGDRSNIMSEVACEPVNLCNLDQRSFKAYLSRWMAATTKWAPWTYDRIAPLLKSSSVAAVSQCTGGDNGRMCGLKWTDNGKNDGLTGVGEQMAAMEVVLANMIKDTPAPVTSGTGGTSKGDPGAGGSDIGKTNPWSILDMMAPITTADRAGAYILTILMIAALIAGVAFMLMDETAGKTTNERMADFKGFVAGGRRKLLRKEAPSPAAAKGKAVDRSDSDGDASSRMPSMLLEKAVIRPREQVLHEPAQLDGAGSAQRRLRSHRTTRSIVSDPGADSSIVPAAYRRSTEMPMGHGRSQSMAEAKRASLHKKVARGSRASAYSAYGPGYA